jgi:hypothetical protein
MEPTDVPALRDRSRAGPSHATANRLRLAPLRKRPRHRPRVVLLGPELLGNLVSRVRSSSPDSRAGHPGWLRCSSLTYSRLFPICSVVAPCRPGAALRDLGNQPLTRGTSAVPSYVPRFEDNCTGSFFATICIDCKGVRPNTRIGMSGHQRSCRLEHCRAVRERRTPTLAVAARATPATVDQQ